MDTNMAQALKLAGGLLIALVLISAVVYMFRALAPTQIALDDVKQFEQTAEFNKEFEVYNKDIMYGLDVISVINKAASYNKTYIDAYGYTEDLKDNYLINIKFNCADIELYQNFTITKVIRNATTGRIVEMEYEKNSPPINPELNISLLNVDSENEIVDKLKRVVKLADNDLDNESRCRALITNYANVLTPQTISGTIELIDSHESDENHKYINGDLYDNIIVPSSKQLKVTIQNNDTSIAVTDTGADQWSKATLETYVYSFKSKKFRCTGTTYSDITGRITSLTFSEI